MRLNSNQLRVFYTVAKLKSISLASNELMVTPPAVSRQIKTLEDFLDLQLIYREGNAIELTEAGSEIFQKALQVFERLEDLESFIQDFSDLKTGSLRVGCPQQMSTYVMPEWIKSFNSKYPGIKVIFETGTSEELIKSVVERKTEIAIIGFKPTQSTDDKIRHLSSSHFPPGFVPLDLISSPTFPMKDKIHIKELADVPLIIPVTGSAVRANILKHFQKHGINPKIFLESPSLEVSKELVIQGKALCFLLGLAVEKELKRGTLRSITILEGHPRISAYIICHKAKPLSPAAMAFSRVIQDFHSRDQIQEQLD